MNLFYVPVTKIGQQVQLVQFWLFKSNWLWPLASDCPKWQNFVLNFVALVFLSSFFATVDAEFLFMRDHEGNLAKIAECLCTTLIGTQFIIRILNFIFLRHQMRRLLQEFFRNIYIHKTENEELHNQCERKLRPVYFMSISMLTALIFMILGVVIFLIRDPHSSSKPYLYQMRFAYDAQEPWKYAFTTMYTGWVGYASVSLISGQHWFIGTILTYCSARYEMLHKDLDTLYERSLRSLAFKAGPQEQRKLHKVFLKDLRVIIQKQQVLDRFTPHLQSFLSVTLFVIITFGVFVLCVLAFQFTKNDIISLESFKYCFWLMSQSLEFLLVGSFGQRYTDAAAEMANSYYMCNWESLLAFGDVKANAQLMRDISFAIYRSQKSVHLNGMKFVILSLNSIGLAMRASLSYFMFLNTMEDISTKRNGNK